MMTIVYRVMGHERVVVVGLEEGRQSRAVQPEQKNLSLMKTLCASSAREAAGGVPMCRDFLGGEIVHGSFKVLMFC